MPEPQKPGVVIEDQPHWRRDRSGDYIELGAIFNVDGERYWIRFYAAAPLVRFEGIPEAVRYRIATAWQDLDWEAVKVGFLDPPKGGARLYLPVFPKGVVGVPTAETLHDESGLLH